MRDAEKCLRAHKLRGAVMRTTGVALAALSRRSSVTFAKYCRRNTYIKTNCQPYSAPNYEAAAPVSPGKKTVLRSAKCKVSLN